MEFEGEVYPRRRCPDLVFLAPSRTLYFFRWILGVSLTLLSLLLLSYFFAKPSGPSLHVPPPSPNPRPGEQALWSQRASRVKAAFVGAYSAYEVAAAPHDELLPLSNGKVDKSSLSFR
jgi:hypothetical protein